MQAKNVALVMFNKPSNNDIPLQHLKSSHRHKLMLHRGDEKKMTVRSLLAKEELGSWNEMMRISNKQEVIFKVVHN